MVLSDSKESPNWMTSAMSQVLYECGCIGATNYLRIAGHLSLTQGIAVDIKSLRAAFEGLPGFCAIDGDSGWFIMGPTENSTAANRVRKLMSVSTGPVGIDVIANALITDDRWIERNDGGALCVPPIYVLSKIIASWSWIVGDKHNKYRLRKPISHIELLNETELHILQTLERKGGGCYQG
ncbi:hypothetical protein V8Z74_14510 [Comamonas sp. w2-DMI]|uniref:hypothetical protein n=1 Tax=Comamonas sp. w2-DMI TaxID=3126391 RepID=UPI0032E377FB